MTWINRTTFVVALAIAAVAVLSQGASARDGVYGCSDSYGIGLGLLTLKGSNYTWTKTNTAFQPQQASENGSGTLKIEGKYFTPVSGPMAKWGVTGAIASNGLNINNNNGNLMGCRSRKS